MSLDVEQTYRRYGPMVLRRCRRLLGDEDVAQEAMQDTFVQLLRHHDRLDARAPSSLLYRMATNVCLNRIRSTGRRPEVPHSELIGRLASLDGSAESRSGAKLVLERLFGRERESTRVIATLHLLDGMTLEEVAEEVGMSVSGVRKRLRGLRKLLVEEVAAP